MGFRMADRHKLTPLQIETDSLDTFVLIYEGNDSFSNIIIECRALLQRLANPQITLRRREQNQVADRLVKEAVKLKENIDFVEWLAPPMFIMKNIDADKEGVTFIRHDMPPSSPISLTLVDNVESIPVFCNMERPATSLFSTNNIDAGKKGANFQTFDMLPPSSDSTDLVANLPSIQANCNASSHLDCMDAYYI
ncbi:hypothetical protein KY289_036942 [Solanum tuberosum]|nr:hypothetical protein KY289_036942 [Solanum tuberosum]